MRRPCTLALAVALGACGGTDDWSLTDTGQGQTNTFTTVWAFAPNDVWFGGTQTLHWDGSAFTSRPPGTGNIIKMSGLAPDDLWGIDGEAVWRWQGAGWNPVPLGTITVSGGLNTIFALSSTDVWAGGGINGEMLHWNGTFWTKYISQVVDVYSIWGVATDDVWIVGQLGVNHWNGASWSTVDVPDAIDAQALWGFGARDIWMVGNFQTLLHWDGVAWRKTDTMVDHTTVWGAAPNDVWAGGENGEISHFDGNGWSEGMLGVTKYVNAIHGAGPGNLWMVGYDIRDRVGLIYRKN